MGMTILTWSLSLSRVLQIKISAWPVDTRGALPTMTWKAVPVLGGQVSKTINISTLISFSECIILFIICSSSFHAFLLQKTPFVCEITNVVDWNCPCQTVTACMITVGCCCVLRHWDRVVCYVQLMGCFLLRCDFVFLYCVTAGF